MKKASAAAEEFFGQGVSRTGFSIPWAPDRCRETWWTVLGGPWVWGTWGCRRLRPRHGTSVPSRGLARRVRVRGSEGRGARVGAGPWALGPGPRGGGGLPVPGWRSSGGWAVAWGSRRQGLLPPAEGRPGARASLHHAAPSLAHPHPLPPPWPHSGRHREVGSRCWGLGWALRVVSAAGAKSRPWGQAVASHSDASLGNVDGLSSSGSGSLSRWPLAAFSARLSGKRPPTGGLSCPRSSQAQRG